MKKALLIGVNEYPNGNELFGCVEDINCVNDVIARNGDGSPNFSVKLLANIKRGKDAMKEIKNLFHGDGECALLYFSGHGYLNDVGGEIVFPDGIESDSYYTGIKMNDILKQAEKSIIRNKVIILDCCHSGAVGNYETQSESCHIGSGISILTACREDEYAMECGGHGLFTEQLCNALRGGAADFCGNITIGGIYAYIDRTFGPWQQRPTFKTNVTEFSPLKKVEPKVPLSIIRKLVDLFPTPNAIHSLDPSYEFTNTPQVSHEIIRPYADPENVKTFKMLQKLQSIGFVEPLGSEHMYFAAMKSQGCKMTPLGQHYWKLVNDKQI